MSPPDWRDPERRRLPFDEWPAAHRQGWQAAVRSGGLLLGRGPGAGLKPLTLKRHLVSYGRWLGWLNRQGRLGPASTLGELATRENIIGYIEHLQTLNAPGTVLVRLQSLAVVLRWLVPDHDGTWLRAVLARLEARVTPVRDKRLRLQPSDALFRLGEQLMTEAEAMPAACSERRRAQLFRDGLMIAFLSCHPERAANFAALELGRHLTRTDKGWWLAIDGSETKNGRPASRPVQQRLVPMIDSYLQLWRPRLASPDRVAGSRAMWLTREGTAISANHLHFRITRHTAAAFGRPVNPHGFRDAAATTVAVADPDRVGIVTPLLNHASLTTAQRHYNLAGMISAAEAWHEVLGGIGTSKRPGLRQGAEGRYRRSLR